MFAIVLSMFLAKILASLTNLKLYRVVSWWIVCRHVPRIGAPRRSGAPGYQGPLGGQGPRKPGALG